jgi:hypothetical protein
MDEPTGHAKGNKSDIEIIYNLLYMESTMENL